jgi:hypothetical protein
VTGICFLFIADERSPRHGDRHIIEAAASDNPALRKRKQGACHYPGRAKREKSADLAGTLLMKTAAGRKLGGLEV